MKFRNFLKTALGSANKIKILRYLLKDEMPASEREIARLLGMSHMSVNRIMKDFSDLNLVIQTKIGGVNMWRINKESWTYGALRSLRDTQTDPLQALKDNFILGAWTDITEAYIFGSVAEGTELPESDIDLLLIIKSKEMEKEIRSLAAEKQETCLKLFGNPLSPHIFTEEEAKQKKNKKIVEKARSRGIKLK
ncbi:MAG: nucleotidyltransferase domain-containing protein [Candidatus Thermoplasmatota archaeon]|nr:nucleotidyltransferase domain-containing protein [Candidatus Thermoplasmatota archaeon]